MYKVSKLLAYSLLTGSILVGCGGGSANSPEPPPQVNRAPTITSASIISATVGEDLSFTVTATDADNDSVTLSVSDLPDWLTFDSGVLSGTPNAEGEFSVEVSATDGEDTSSQTITITVAPEPAKWQLVWSDEFDGESLNTQHWNIETGDGSQYGIPGWGNNELEWYQGENIAVAEGELIITAKEESSNGYNYTSGRMRSDGKVDIKYGRIEAKIKAPAGQGLWPAFWMLPTDSQYGGWASGGEIDIMEIVSAQGNADDSLHGTIHFGMAWPLNASDGGSVTGDWTNDYHVYAIEWDDSEIRWYVNDTHFATASAQSWWSYYYKDLNTGYDAPEDAPFNQSFHLLLNLAVGGNWPGSPNADTVFPSELRVDYVRVYECESGNTNDCASSESSEAVTPYDVFTTSYELYSDGAQSIEWQVANETVSSPLTASIGWDNQGAISFEETDIGGDNGMVIDITTTGAGNVVINSADGDSFDLFGMSTSQEPWKLAAGELKFDLFIDSSNTPENSNIIVKMDSGWPAVGSKTIPVSDLVMDEWQSISVKINDIVATPGEQGVNMSTIVNLFVLEFSDAAHVQVDNISLKCGHKDSNGCGINPPAVEIVSDQLVVFDDAVNSTVWTNGIGAWDTTRNTDYFDGNGFVSWDVIDAEETDRGQVLDVVFGSGNTDGLLYIQSAQGVDMSSYVDGELSFDLKVMDYANTQSGMSYKVDCIYPCTTGDQVLGVVADGSWETITIPVSSLVSNGLDLTKVNTGLVIYPTWGDQQGVHFQVDNIVWKQQSEGEQEPSETNGPIAIFDGSLDSNWTLWDCCGGATLTEESDAERGIVVKAVFNPQPTVAGLEATEPHDASNVLNATLEFDFKLTTPPSDSSALWLLKVESADANKFAEVELKASNEGIDPVEGQWQHFSFPLDTLAAQGLDVSALKLVMIFPSWGQANGAVYHLDNLEIKEN